MIGFEPTTACSQSKSSARLSYTPIRGGPRKRGRCHPLATYGSKALRGDNLMFHRYPRGGPPLRKHFRSLRELSAIDISIFESAFSNPLMSSDTLPGVAPGSGWRAQPSRNLSGEIVPINHQHAASSEALPSLPESACREPK